MNVLHDILPARWRKRLYLLFSLLNAAVLACAAADISIGKVPVALAAFGAALGLTAASNTSEPPQDIDPA